MAHLGRSLARLARCQGVSRGKREKSRIDNLKLLLWCRNLEVVDKTITGKGVLHIHCLNAEERKGEEEEKQKHCCLQRDERLVTDSGQLSRDCPQLIAVCSEVNRLWGGPH